MRTRQFVPDRFTADWEFAVGFRYFGPTFWQIVMDFLIININRLNTIATKMHLPGWIVDIFRMADINQSRAIIHRVKLCRRSQSTSKHGRGWWCPGQRCHRFIGYDWHFYLKKKNKSSSWFQIKNQIKTLASIIILLVI